MDFIDSLLASDYLLYNVNEKKIPVDSKGMQFSWSKITLEKVKSIRNLESTMWGMRTGLQPNGKYIIGLDFDMWYQQQDKYVSSENTRVLFEELKVINPDLSGVFCSSTELNKGVFCDITECTELIELLSNIGKSKFNCKDYHLEIMNGCNWVLPPSLTICKINNTKLLPRKFLNDNKNYILNVEKESHIYKFIFSYINNYFTDNNKAITDKNVKSKKAKEAYIEYTTINDKNEYYMCNSLELLKPFINALSIDRVDNYNEWWKIGYSLKAQFGEKGYPLFSYFSIRGDNYNEKDNKKIWDSWNIKENNYKGLTKNFIINCVKLDDPDNFIILLIGYKLELQKIYEDKEAEKYLKTKKELELNVIKILEPPVWVKRHRITKEWDYCNYSDILHCYSSIYGKEFMKKFTDDDDIKYLDSITFDPDPNFKNTKNHSKFNLYTPMDIIKYKPKTDKKKEAINLIETHLKHLCNHDNNAIIFLTQWTAWILHLPHLRTKVVPILKGGEGEGKGSFYDLIYCLMGSKYCSTTSTAERSIFGRFNDNIANKLFVCINEANFDTFNKYMEDFKSLITDPTYEQETKGKPIITIDNYINFIITTNNDRIFNISNSNRRFYFIETSSKLAGDKKYFDNYHESIKDKDILYYIYDYFKSKLDKDFDFNHSIRHNLTNYHKLMNESSINPFYNFVQETYTDMVEAQNSDYTLTSKDIVRKWSIYCENNGYKNHENAKSMKLKLIKLDPNIYKLKRTNDGIKRVYQLSDVLVNNMKLSKLWTTENIY